MHLEQRFYRLPLRFDVERLREEISQFPESAWRPHPTGYAGNTALILISSHGGQNDDMDCPMQPTEYLARCPYVQQVLASFNTVLGRSRLMRLEGGARVNRHADVAYYWRTRTRIHIPIITDPSISFHCEDEQVHMAAGEAWTFDNWLNHKVENPSDVTRIHLVVDTVGTAAFWNMLKQAADPRNEAQLVPFKKDQRPRLQLENFDRLPVMAPGELDANLARLEADLAANPEAPPAILADCSQLLADLRHEWRALWMLHGPSDATVPLFRELAQQALEKAANFPESLHVASNKLTASSILGADLSAALGGRLPAAQRVHVGDPQLAGTNFDRPIFIVAAPRSGSTLLFETLISNMGLWSLGDEGHQQVEGIRQLHPAAHDYASNRLTAADATPETASALRMAFASHLRNARGVMLQDVAADKRPAKVRFLEKTPKNSLRIPFLKAVFPDARFIYLHRNPRDNISSLLDSWRSGRYITYRKLPGWDGMPWSHLLIPGWQALADEPLAEVVATQWAVTNRIILEDLEQLPASDWCSLSHEAFLADPGRELERLCRFADIPFGSRMQAACKAPLPNSKYTLTPPDPDKWKKNASELETVLTAVSELSQRLQDLPA